MLSNGVAEVMTGPFAGLKVPPGLKTDNLAAAYILGTYEQPVVHRIMKMLSPHRPRFLNIGCGSGYFTNGVAFAANVETIGFDTDPERVISADLIRDLNDLETARHVRTTAHEIDYADYIREGDLVLVDIEGAEYALLQPEKTPALVGADYIVELHSKYGYDQDTGRQEIIRRFADTHEAEVLRQRLELDYSPRLFATYPWLTNYMLHVAAFEYRSNLQNWLVLRRKKPAGVQQTS